MIVAFGWLAYFVPMAAIGVGFAYWMLTQVPTIAAREMQRHQPPPGVELDPASAQAIHDEIDRRKRFGCYAAAATHCVVIALTHPMYAPDGWSDTALSAIWPLSVAAGFVTGETYAVMQVARSSKPVRRTTTLRPRNTTTYLSPVQRSLQTGFLATAAVGAVGFTVLATSTNGPDWARPAMFGGWIWLAVICGLLAIQRQVLSHPMPIDSDDDVLVREVVTSNAMQLLFRATGLTGLLAYFAVVTSVVSPHREMLAIAAGALPITAFVAVDHALRRWLHRPDPLWYFVRTAEGPV